MANELMLECLRSREEVVFHAAADTIERLERERDEARAACAKFAIALREHGPKNCTCRFLPYLGKVPPCATCRVKALLDDFRGE